MKMTLRALSALLGYPSDELKAHASEIRLTLEEERTLAAAERNRLEPLLGMLETSDLLDLQAAMDVAIFGIGSPFAEVPSHVYQGGYLERADYQALSRDGVVGDVATVFYRADGSTDGIAMNARGTGPDFATLRRAPRRICVVSGRAKLPSLTGALAAGLITDLIVDEGTARGLVEEAAPPVE